MEHPDNLSIKSLSSDEINKIEEFRKSKHTAVLAILFSDIVNSTYATEKLGEQVYSRLRHIHDELFTTIMCRDNAGVIIKQIGDSFLCVFAEPSTSVLRATEFQRAIRKNKAHLTVNNYTLTVKIGIHIGQVIVENKLAMDIFGSHVNRAARIESIANGGQILTSQSIWENAVGWLKENNEQAIGWVSYGKTRLKGIDEKINIYGFYPKESGPSSVPAIFRKQRRNRILLGLIGLAILAIGSFFLVKNFNGYTGSKKEAASTPGRKSFYIQFDFSETPNLDSSALSEIFLSQFITAMYPDSIVTEADLIKSFTKKGELYKRKIFPGMQEEKKYLSDTLHFSGGLFIKSIWLGGNKNDSVCFRTGLALWKGGSSAAYSDSLRTNINDLKDNFRNWLQKRLTEYRLRDEIGEVLESNDSIILFKIPGNTNISHSAAIELRRIYSNKEGLDRWLLDHQEKMDYMKDKPELSKELKDEKKHFEKNVAEMTYDLTNTKGSWVINLKISGKVIELYDSVGKATWKNNSVFPFIKPRKGDMIFLSY